MNQYGLFGTLYELHLLAKNVSLLDYELFNTQGYRSQKDALLKTSKELMSKYEDKILKNTGGETDLYEELKKFT
jgi:propanediol dehydratase small subunit